MNWKDEDPGLPIKCGPYSNAEYDPEPLMPLLRQASRRARADCARNARRVGLSRREFLLSIGGAATTLLALDPCTREAVRSVARGSTPGGGYSIPPEARTDPEVAHAPADQQPAS